MKHLYFVRHGETEANVAEVFSGTTETPLTPKGKQQARLAGEHAKGLSIDHIICSPLGRAHETAMIIAAEVGYPLDKIELNSLFIERHFGEAENKPHHMFIDTNVDGFIDVEATDSLLERAKLALEHLLQLPYDSVLLVSHGTFGRALRSHIQPHMPFAPGNEATRFKNAEIVKLI